ncbi:hypothetical protein PDE_02415 [Penicillium oxalicum 114-2]|uniref:Uncharacterized protein n=1 Tax=Penicillium oxalicum (strain 114-2 / CGMCC 5302) TaxID=933388 RepID=S8AZN6_PENO1|nr:hypothetical protein PDE_02415 [Penicillium oxalicum 114-2]
MRKSPSPPQKTVLYASKTKHEGDFVKAAQDKMVDEARTLRHYSPENAVANSSGLELLQSLRELRQRQEALEASDKEIRVELDKTRESNKDIRVELDKTRESNKDIRAELDKTRESNKDIRAELDETREINNGLRDNIGELERRQHNARQRIISTFVRETRLPPRGAARRAALRSMQDRDLAWSIGQIPSLNQEVHGGDILLDAPMILKRFRPSDEEWQAFIELYGVEPGVVMPLGNHNNPPPSFESLELTWNRSGQNEICHNALGCDCLDTTYRESHSTRAQAC